MTDARGALRRVAERRPSCPTKPDRALTRRILDGVAARTIVDPWSGRTLVGQLV